MKTGLTKKHKVTEVYYNAKDPAAEVYTHNAKQKSGYGLFDRESHHLSNRDYSCLLVQIPSFYKQPQ